MLYGIGVGFQEKIFEDNLATGKGKSTGFECMVRKNKGKSTGWIGYTLAWANRQYDNVSNGKVFPYKYDRRHDISLVVSHKFNNRIEFVLFVADLQFLIQRIHHY